MKLLPALALAVLVAWPPAHAADPAELPPSSTVTQPPPSWYDWQLTPWGPMLKQTGPVPPWHDYQMNRVLSPEDKQRMMEMAMPLMGRLMQLDAREAMNWFAVKLQAKPGLSYDEVVESLKLAANAANLKFVGHNPLWKDFEAVLGDKHAPRVEIFSFCDIAVGRELLKYIPEMVVFLPCRIAVMQMEDGSIWLLTMDWDMTWLDLAGKGRGVPDALRTGVQDIQKKLLDAMRAGAEGRL